jgi:hypothetical protein
VVVAYLEVLQAGLRRYMKLGLSGTWPTILTPELVYTRNCHTFDNDVQFTSFYSTGTLIITTETSSLNELRNHPP